MQGQHYRIILLLMLVQNQKVNTPSEPVNHDQSIHQEKLNKHATKIEKNNNFLFPPSPLPSLSLSLSLPSLSPTIWKAVKFPFQICPGRL